MLRTPWKFNLQEQHDLVPRCVLCMFSSTNLTYVLLCARWGQGSGGEAVKDVMEGFQTPDGTMATRRSSRSGGIFHLPILVVLSLLSDLFYLSASGAHNVAAPFQKPGHSDSTTVESVYFCLLWRRLLFTLINMIAFQNLT